MHKRTTSIKSQIVLSFLILFSVGRYGSSQEELASSTQIAEQNKSSTPLFTYRCLYAPAHFGNSYEVMGEREMRDMLTEAAYWGFNRYADWFDMSDCADPFAGRPYKLGGVLWSRKKANFLSTQKAGLACELVITPNHVYLDQVTPERRAVKKDRIFGQLICPSRADSRQVILDNYRNLFSDLAESGVRLSSLVAAPYDYGGCACSKCQPWILTFAKLCKDIHKIAEEYHPGIEMHFIGWWWSETEHALFADWADREAPGWVKSIALHIPYGETTVSDVRLPKGCERRAFIHIGYGDIAKPRDIYGHLGPVVAPIRIPETVRSLYDLGVTGFMAYSEGVYEDVNKALVAGLSSGRYKDADAVLDAYAIRYFKASNLQVGKWTSWVKPWGRTFEVDAAKAGEALDKLSAKWKKGWRLQQWRIKSRLLHIHSQIMSETEWTPHRLSLVEDFWAVKENLDRNVYGLGPVRHILSRDFTSLPWYKSWMKRKRENDEK